MGKPYLVEGRLNIKELISRTRCRICREKGQWAPPSSDTAPFCVGALAVGMRLRMALLVPMDSLDFFWRADNGVKVFNFARNKHVEFSSSDVQLVFCVMTLPLLRLFPLRTVGHIRTLDVGKGKFCSREVMQAADGSLRVGHPANIKSLDCVPLGKLRKEQSGDATETEKNAIRSVLGAVGYSARESQPNLSWPVSILQVVSTELKCRTSKKQTVWSDWLRHTQISHCLFVKFLQITSVLCLTQMPVLGVHELNEQA